MTIGGGEGLKVCELKNTVAIEVKSIHEASGRPLDEQPPLLLQHLQPLGNGGGPLDDRRTGR